MSTMNAARTLLAIGVAMSAATLGTGAGEIRPGTALDVPGRSDSTPWIAAAGSFVAVAWGATADGRTDVFVATSRDGGETFGAPVRVNQVVGEARLGGELPPRIALHTTDGAAAPTVVVLWTARGDTTAIKTARSTDGGATFDTPVALQSAAATGDRGWPALTLDHRGVAHAIWLDHRGLAAHRAAGGGHHAHQKPSAVDGVAMAQGSGLYHASVGETTAMESEIAKGVCYCCKTALAVGSDGALYAAWRHVYQGNLRDMAMSVSPDGGRSFSAPARISEDGWAINGCPDNGPSIAVDGEGTVHVVWPTVVGGDTPEGALFYATTKDGQHFTPRVRIPTLGGPKPTHPQIAIGSTGRVVVAWEESVAGRRVAAMREVRTGVAEAMRFGEVATIVEGGSANHPVLAHTTAGVVAAWASGGDTSRVEVRVLQLP